MTPTDDLQALYAAIPDPGCKGLCHEACGPILASPLERDRMAVAGHPLPDEATLIADLSALVESIDAGTARDGRTLASCPALSAFGRCRAYDSRPVVCRLYGAAEGLECRFGCRPEGGLLTRAQAGEFIRRADEIGRRI